MTDITDTPVTAETEAERRRKEAYFTASQAQLIWARFRKQRAAMVGASSFLLMTSTAYVRSGRWSYSRQSRISLMYGAAFLS